MIASVVKGGAQKAEQPILAAAPDSASDLYREPGILEWFQE
jgi:hypothetical protein